MKKKDDQSNSIISSPKVTARRICRITALVCRVFIFIIIISILFK